MAILTHHQVCGEWRAGRALALCLLVSATAHAGMMAALPQDNFTRQAPPARLQVNLMSLAAPAIEPQKIEPQAGTPDAPSVEIVSMPNPVEAIAPKKPAPEKPKPQQQAAAQKITSNNKGQDVSTVVPVVRDLQALRQSAPEYPSRARRMGQQGEVLLHALVDVSGRPRDLKVAVSSGYDSLDSAAVKAVRGWEFKPALRDGKALTVWAEVPVRFVLR